MMETTDARYRAYLNILTEELMPALGCTEPIAVAYAAARAAAVLKDLPDRVLIEASDNIVKNVKSVVVPNTGGLRGIASAAAAGIAAGDPDRQLEVIAQVDTAGKERIRRFLDTCVIQTLPLASDILFDLKVTVFKGSSRAMVQISHFHTNIVLIEKDGDILYRNQDCDEVNTTALTDRTRLNVKDIVDFADSASLTEIKGLLEKMVDYNMAIAEQGMTGHWGANIGTVLREVWGDDVKIRAKAMAAAGSDARMSGCELPGVIVSGSGNQGITASVPVVVYARHLEADQDTLFRALVISCLVTVHQKTGIGRLSAYCGAVSAGVGAGAGITWLHGGRYREIAHTIVNALAMVSGIICDGAKPSCAAKIAMAVEAGLLGFFMFQKGKQFYGGDGIVRKGVENTIANIGRLGRDGMRETDKEIIRMMLGQ